MKKGYLKIFAIGLFCFSALAASSQYTWTQMANFPGSARAFAASFSIGHYGYVGCGYNISNSNYSDWWRWNQNTNTWSSIANYPGAGQIGCSSFSINGTGYVGLGSDGGTVHTDLWKYDTTTNTWTQMASFPGAGRYRAATFVIGTNAYVCTGSPGAPPYLTDCWEYNSLANTWKQIANFPIPRNQVDIAFSVGKYGYAGSGGSGGAGTFIDSMYKYDTAANAWNAIAALPCDTGLANQAYFMLNDTAYSVSGVNNLDYYLNGVFSYNTVANTWSSQPNFPGIARLIAVGFSIGNKGYIATGYDSLLHVHADLWQYGPVSTAGIGNINNSINILLYPNPANNEIYVQLNRDEKADLVGLYTITGQKVLEEKLSSQYSSLNVQSLPNGVYFLRVEMQDGSLETKKVEILR